MTRYCAIIDGEIGAYGVAFPDLPGIVAMGATVDEALVQAEQALRDYAIEAEKDGEELVPPRPMDEVSVSPGQMIVSVPLVRISGKNVRANMTLDEGILALIDSESRRRGMTRQAYVEWMALRIAQMGG